jgi:RNA ligase (TIGR02306 family)
MEKRKLASIKQIDEIKEIEGADKIEVAQIGGWNVVVEKNKYKKDELIIFCEIDSLLPLDNPAWAFLEGRSAPRSVTIDGKVYTGYKLKSIRLKGQLSQGLVLPLSVIPVTDMNLGDLLRIGDDVSEVLGIVKWEAAISAQLAGQVKGNFPSFLNKTDEERVQNYRKIIQNNVGLLMYVTEKLDGTSTTFYKHEGVFGVCSRNMDLKETEGNSQWKSARELKIEENLPEGYALQGELIGEGIQGNPLKRSGQEFYAFNVFDIIKGEYLDFEELTDFLAYRNIPMVPIVASQFKLTADIQSIIEMADGRSMLSEDCIREGLVFRPLHEMRENGDRGGRFSFKSISNAYLLKHEN